MNEFIFVMQFMGISLGVLAGIALLTIISVYAIAFFQYLIER